MRMIFSLLLLAPTTLAARPVVLVAAPTDQRVLGLAGAPNFRDLGGYRTTDGRQVRWGEVYRSNKLSALTPADIARIRPLHIASLIDFRAADERGAEPDRWQPGFVYASPKLLIAPVTTTIMAHPETGEGVRQGMRNLYAHMPANYAPEYAAMLHRLAASNDPLVMHCTAGKDRTGVASAILLSLLGVPRATVVQDYTLTQSLLPPPYAAISPKAGVSTSQMSPDALAAVLAADPSYIAVALDTIERDYGSVDAYAIKALGVSRAEIEAIRARLLIPAKG